jgi:hypothetical protein
MSKLLREKYKTYEGARKRCAFENGIAPGEYARGDKFGMTPCRMRWLLALADCKPKSWARMPYGSNKTWRPMVDAGLISAHYGPVPGKPWIKDQVFTITDAGLNAIGEEPAGRPRPMGRGVWRGASGGVRAPRRAGGVV